MSALLMPVRPSEPTSRKVVEPAALAGGRSVTPANASTRSIERLDQESSVYPEALTTSTPTAVTAAAMTSRRRRIRLMRVGGRRPVRALLRSAPPRPRGSSWGGSGGWTPDGEDMRGTFRLRRDRRWRC